VIRRLSGAVRHGLMLSAIVMPVTTAQGQQFAPDPGVDAVFAEYDRPDAPGCAVGVYQDGAVRYARGYGLADLERRVPIGPETVFDIGSTSKQFTATAILLLAQEGKLSLDDDVRRFLPELPEYQRPITVRHLLHHTSGVRDYIGLLRLAGMRYDDVTTDADAFQMIVRQRALNFAPGDEHLYSNSGYFLLSLIVERVAGRSLRDEARDRIFAPLKMAHTSYLGSYNDVIPYRAIGYEPAGEGYRTDMPRWLQLGDGAVFTTVLDLLHWEKNFRSTEVGGQVLQDALHTRGVLTSGEVLSYAAGLMHGEHRGLPRVFHGGSWGGYVAELLRFPAQRYGVAVLCNRSDANPPALALKVAEVHLAALMAAPSAVPEPVRATAPAPEPSRAVQLRPLPSYAGSYRASPSGNLLTIRVVDGTLKVFEPGRYDLRALSADTLEVIGPPVVIRLVFNTMASAETPATRVETLVNGSVEEVYERLMPMSLTKGRATEFVGTYQSDELGTSLQVTQSDTLLQLKLRNAALSPLRSVGEDEFIGGGLTVRFIRDASAKVTGLALDQGRARGMRFERVLAEP
jgi:CubicO group peptidase (beta-lactamase class C family)